MFFRYLCCGNMAKLNDKKSFGVAGIGGLAKTLDVNLTVYDRMIVEKRAVVRVVMAVICYVLVMELFSLYL